MLSKYTQGFGRKILFTLLLPNSSGQISTPPPDPNQTMCNNIEYGEKYSSCTHPSKHVIKKRRYDKCQKALDTGYTCDDATPAKGLNGEPIQIGTSKKTGACPSCLS
jgi:hypothetical protein